MDVVVCVMVPKLLLLSAAAAVFVGSTRANTVTTGRPYVPCSSVQEQFLCRSEDRCIDGVRRCDGTEDCQDGLDERGCKDDGKGGFKCADENFFKCECRVRNISTLEKTVW